MRRWLTLAVVIPILALAAAGDQKPTDVVGTAKAFLASLDREQHRRTVLPFDGDYRTLWRYTPVERLGISWKDLDVDQTAKAHALIKASLSDMGYVRTQTVRTIEQALSQIENSSRRDKDNYLFTFFGAPDTGAKWGWRYEGHHISLNFTYDGSKLVSSTPQFFGSNPAEVPSGEHKGMRMLAKEEDLAIQFLADLTPDQKEFAIVESTAPSEIFTAESRTAQKQEVKGIPFGRLDASQQSLLLALIRANAEAQDPAEVKRRMDAIEKAGRDKIVFTWMGARDRSAAHYYRIQGPTFLIEFDNSQNRANHIHLVWRDFEGDFGRDVLKEHYKQHEHDAGHGHDH